MNRLKSILLLGAIASALLLWSCSEEEAPPDVAPVAQVRSEAGFQAPQNPQLSAELLHKYQEASLALLLLQQQWMDRIDQAQGQDKILLLQALEKSKAQVCTKVGLKGFEEYLWIQSVLPLPVNREVAQLAGIVLAPKSTP